MTNNGLEAILERRPDRGTDLTLYDPSVDDYDLMTHWLTAHEGSYVALEDAR